MPPLTSSAIIEAQVPEYAAAKMSPRHVSDMNLLAAFFEAQRDGSHQNPAPNPYIYHRHHAHEDTLVALANLRSLFPEDVGEALCIDDTIFDAFVRLSETQQQYYVNGTWHTLPGAHFQGSDCKAHLVRTLGRPVLASFGWQV